MLLIKQCNFRYSRVNSPLGYPIDNTLHLLNGFCSPSKGIYNNHMLGCKP